MASVYAKFSKGDFSHINKNLSVVDYYLTAKKAQEEMIAEKRKHELARDEQAKSTGAMLESLRSRLKELAVIPEGTSKPKSSEALQQAVKRMQSVSGTPDAQRRATKDIVLSIIPIFCSFDEEQFNKAAKPILDDNMLLNASVAKTRGAYGGASGRYSTAIKNWSGIFADGFEVRGFRDTDKAEHAYNEATRFADVWRQRARCFLIPVTIEGTSIASLPPDIRDIWANAYKNLGFNDLKKADVYMPYRHEYAFRSRKEALNG